MESPLLKDSVAELPEVGAVIQHKYKLKRRLGAGGMGAVYEAEHLLLRSSVAVKVMLPQHGVDPRVVARFVREGRLLVALDHPHIVRVSDLGQYGIGGFFLVMELLRGRDLGSLLEEKGHLSHKRAANLVLQLCSALGAVHAAGVVHRDVKPDNTFLVERPDGGDFVKLVDFGIATAGLEDEGLKLTKTSTVMGTPYYMAPEQSRGAALVDHRADIYAAGVLLYQCVTGALPFYATNLFELIAKVMTEPPRPLRELRPEVPEAFEAVVLKMIAKAPEQRYGSCEEVRQALLPFVEKPALSMTIPIAPPRPPSTDEELGAKEDSGTLLDGSPPSSATLDPSAGVLLRTPTSNAVTAARSPVLLLAGGALLVAGLAAVGLRAASTSRAATEPPAPVVAPVAAQPPAPPAPTGPTRLVRVRIDIQPRTAEVTIDDRRIRPPYDAEEPASATLHRLVAQAPGYRRLEQTLVFTDTVDLSIAMVRADGSPEPPAAPPPPSGHGGRGGSARRNDGAPAAPPAAPAAAPASPSPAAPPAPPAPAAPPPPAPHPPPRATGTQDFGGEAPGL